jgi:hypothetical protein
MESALTIKLDTIGREVEGMARTVAKIEGLIRKGLAGTHDYETLKQEALEMSVNISYQIEEDFSYAEKKSTNAKLLFEAFNSQVEKLKRLIS